MLIYSLRRLCSTIACLTSLARGAIVDQDRPAMDLKRRLSCGFDTILRLHKSIGQCDSCIVFAGSVFIGIGSIEELPRKIPFAQTSDVGTHATMMDPTRISFRRRGNVVESSRQRRTRAVDSMSKEALSQEVGVTNVHALRRRLVEPHARHNSRLSRFRSLITTNDPMPQ